MTAVAEGAGVPVGRQHGVERLTIEVSRLADGSLEVTTPNAPGWRQVARDAQHLNRAVRTAFTEVEIASYARLRGTVYDVAEIEFDRIPLGVDAHTHRHPAEPPPAPVSWAAGHRRPDTHDAGDWTPLPDGRWQAPGGRKYRPDASLVASVIARRSAAGLPITA